MIPYAGRVVTPALKSMQRPRELRRRVVVRARLRIAQQWGDACILNISSRGLLIQSARPVVEGSVVEIIRGNHLIVARVVWSAAGRSGLRSEERLPVEDILSLEQARGLQLIASHGVIHDRRDSSREASADARTRGRQVEFVAVAAIAVLLAYAVLTMARQALGVPLAAATAVLGG